MSFFLPDGRARRRGTGRERPRAQVAARPGRGDPSPHTLYPKSYLGVYLFYFGSIFLFWGVFFLFGVVFFRTGERDAEVRAGNARVHKSLRALAAVTPHP